MSNVLIYPKKYFFTLSLLMIKLLYKNKNYIAQQILKSLTIVYLNKKKKPHLKYNFFFNTLQKFSLQIFLFLKSCFIFYWLVIQFN